MYLGAKDMYLFGKVLFYLNRNSHKKNESKPKLCPRTAACQKQLALNSYQGSDEVAH